MRRRLSFAVERVAEPSASEDTVRRFPIFAGCRIVPLWLIIRCRKPGAGILGKRTNGDEATA
jgi:hypothetical protein